jgi:hypothetical protein
MMLRRSGNQALGVPGAITDLRWPPAGGSVAPCGRVWQTAGAGGCWLHPSWLGTRIQAHLFFVDI